MLSKRAQRVQDALTALDMACEVVELPATTRTAVEAAQAIGCGVAQIAKSLVFKTKQTNRPVLVIASGVNRVNEKKVGRLLGEKLGKAKADFVREKTGFAIGGVPPVGHVTQMVVFVDQDLLQYDEIWAAAGTPFAVFSLSPADLERIAPGRVTDIT